MGQIDRETYMLYRWSHTVFPNITKGLTRHFYDLVSHFDRDARLTLMNYGYVSLDESAETVALSPDDEKSRLQIQLYHHIAGAVDWTGLDAVEIGSGRGGGASFIKRHFNPRRLVGVDFSQRAVNFCKHHYADLPGLEFIQGDAESLNLPAESFDIVFNVESSLYYPNVEKFFKNVARILRPNGIFLYTDMRYFEDLASWKKQVTDAGLELLSEEDITPNTKKALALDQENRRNLIERYVPKFFHRPFRTFAGTESKLAHGSPRIGERVYMNFVYRKPPAG